MFSKLALLSCLIGSVLLVNCQNESSNPTFSSEESYLEKNGLNGPVKSIHIYELNPETKKPEGNFSVLEFDQDGNRLSKKRFLDDSTLIRRVQFKRQKGKLISETTYNASDEIIKLVKHTYKNGIRVKTSSSSTNHGENQEILYDNQGRVVEQKTFTRGEPKDMAKITYSGDKKITEKADYRIGLTTTNIEVYDHENNRQIIRANGEYLGTKQKSELITTYDPEGLVIKIVESNDGKITAKATYDYEFDSSQNWTLQIERVERITNFSDEFINKSSITSRKIEYY